jgi:uncharacterized protein
MRSKLFLLVSILVLGSLLAACGPAASTAANTRSLSVSGTGTVYLTPDIAYIYVGVETHDSDISKALADNNIQAQAVVDALKNLGVAPEDIQTSNFSIYSMQDYNDVGQEYTKYVVNNNVYITVRDLSKLGSLLSTVVASGANTINSISFDVSDKTAAQSEARQKAMDNANALASELASIGGVHLGEIQTLSYSEYYPTYYASGMGGGGASAPNASVPIQVGQFEVSVTVSVTYGIK